METTLTRLLKVWALGATLALAGGAAGAATLLIGNTSGNNVVLVDTVRETIRTFIAAGAGGLTSPDDITVGPDGNLYVSSGNDTSGAILRFSPRDGSFIDVFATAPSLKRPYGHAFGPDGKLYVASFRSDEILRFDGATGAFLDVFASGTGGPDGLNGPNDLYFGPDGKLYVTTQGSVADGAGGITFLHESQILRYDIATGVGELFARQPIPAPESFGFVSFLGLALGPDGNLWTSDFANGLRVYDFDGMLLDTLSTNYTGTVPSNNFIGSLAFDDAGLLYVVGFDLTKGNVGSLLAYESLFGAGVTDPGFTVAAAFRDNPALMRPIGVLVFAPIPLPAPAALLLAGLVGLALTARARPSSARAARG